MNTTRISYAVLAGIPLFFGAIALGHEESPADNGELKIIDDGGQPVGACPLRHRPFDLHRSFSRCRGLLSCTNTFLAS